MRVESDNFLDRYGHEVVLRNAEPSDAAVLIRYLKDTSSETPYLIREPEEVSLSEEQDQKIIQRKIDAERELMLVAIADGRLAWACSLMRMGELRRFRHRCELAIALYQKYCGKGIGKRMMEVLLDAAEKAGYEQAELEVIADNERAIVLYEKLGFQKYGTFQDYMKYRDGTYGDAFWMMKKL